MTEVTRNILLTLLLLALVPAVFALDSSLTLQGGISYPMTDVQEEVTLHGAWGLSYEVWLKEWLSLGLSPYMTRMKAEDGLNRYTTDVMGGDLFLKLRPVKGLALNFSEKAIINRISPFIGAGIGVANYSSTGNIDDGDPLTLDDSFDTDKTLLVSPHLSAGLSFLTKWNVNLDLGVKAEYLAGDELDGFKDPDYQDAYLMPYLGIGFNFGAPRDSDGDGIPNKKDKAPYDPEDFDGYMDEDGAPDPDNDGDGVPDIIDGAPNEAEDKDGFMDEDGIPDPDNDKDGIPDITDGAPNDPEDKDNFQDKDGVPDPDNDNDRIPDVRDQAPGTDETVRKGIDTKETYNDYLDEDGVPDQVPGTPAEPEPELVLHVVHFETNMYDLSASDKLLLDAVAASLKSMPAVKLQVQGHTDNTGTDAINVPLGQNRAKAVKDYLVGKGVDSSRLDVKGLSDTKPVDTNDTPEGRAANRRADFIILK